jgi:hypothetical protein
MVAEVNRASRLRRRIGNRKDNGHGSERTYLRDALERCE